MWWLCIYNNLRGRNSVEGVLRYDCRIGDWIPPVVEERAQPFCLRIIKGLYGLQTSKPFSHTRSTTLEMTPPGPAIRGVTSSGSQNGILRPNFVQACVSSSSLEASVALNVDEDMLSGLNMRALTNSGYVMPEKVEMT